MSNPDALGAAPREISSDQSHAKAGEGGFAAGLLASVPVALGYFPIAFSFGVAATRAGLTEVEAIMLSVVIYAGAAQFLALALVTGGAPVLVAAFALVAMNLRHLMYGPALLERAGKEARRRWSWIWAWGLTDEVFGAAIGAMARGQRFNERFIFALGLAAYAAWIGGTAAGAAAGGGALEDWPAIEAGLGFMLTALFLALLLSILSGRQIPVVIGAALATVAVSLMIGPTAGVLAGMLAGAAVGVMNRRAG